MSYNDFDTPADPITISNSADPSSPPSIEDSQQGSSALPSSSSALPRFPQLKLRIKLGRETPLSAPQIMESSVAYKYGNNDDGHETSGDESNFRFSGVNANAVRSSLNNETNGSETAADNESISEDAPTAEQSPKKELRKRTSASSAVSDSGSPKKSGRKGAKRGRKPKAEKEDKEEEEEKKEDEEGGDDEEEVYEVERILEHRWNDDGVLLYKVKWVGYGPEFDTFEPEEMLESAKERLAEYRKSLPVECRLELEAEQKKDKKKKKGRPSNASKSGKRPRSDSAPLMPSDDSDFQEKDSDDEEYGGEKRKKAGPSTSTASATRSRGRPPKSKGELKLFASPKSAGPPRKKPFLENRQGWLDESDSESDNGSKKDKKEVKRESPAPKRGETGRKGRGATREEASEEKTMTNGTRHSSRGGVASSSSSTATVEGLYRHPTGEVNVVLTEGRSQTIVSLRDAHDMVGFGLVQYLADRFEFQE